MEGGVSILQYADDTILFLEHDLLKAVNMKLILCLFEQLSGLQLIFIKVNFSALVRQRKKKLSTNRSLDVRRGPFLLNT